MKRVRTLVLTLSLLATLAYFYSYTRGKERLMRDGNLFLFELAPVDPRSLMQGDYMALRYDITWKVPHDSLPDGGYLVFGLDEGDVAYYRRVQEDLTPLGGDEHLIRFRRRGRGGWRADRVEIASTSYFFQEGEGDKYATARYGGIRVDESGNAILVGLYDTDGELIQ